MAEQLPAGTELLFSYGTLQQERVQLETFGRRLRGAADELVGYRSGWLEIADWSVNETSGKSHHPIIAFTGQPTDVVQGTVFLVSGAELLRADAYEAADYRRVSVKLASGNAAWVYVDERDERRHSTGSGKHSNLRKEQS
jgi:gamma-glutamylcyclotransferase (GGCT)/AIG2-like uncharacterized protein YtfP